MKISRRVKASRANGAKSRGPKTEEGKLRSQTHAIRHGLLARCVVLEGEDRATFLLLVQELEERFAPVDEVELGFIEEMAAAYWRMRRGWTIEAELLNAGLHSQPPGHYNVRLAAAFTSPDQMPKLCLLQRYESRLHRMYQRALNNLLELRRHKSEQRITEQPDPISEHPAGPQPEPIEALGELAPKRPIASDSLDRAHGTPLSMHEAPPPPQNPNQKPAA